tara:strand:+ start:1797 stop:2756 length:960 start_codon:yes stop_codon:yes gene_type:complete
MPVGLTVLDIETNEIGSLSTGDVKILDPLSVDVINPRLGYSVIVSGVSVDSPNGSSIKIHGGSGLSVSSGAFSTSVGVNASNSSTGTQNSAFGTNALRDNTTGEQNTALGSAALLINTTGNDNTGVGYNALGNITGSSNVGIGSTSGGVSSGNDNISIGSNSAYTSTSGDNNIVIGSMATKSSATASNSITLGNGSISVLRCAQTSITSLSDARDKKDIKDLSTGLEFVEALRPVEFTWDDRDEKGRHDIADFGFIAQDLKKAQEDAEKAEVLKLVYDENPDKLEASYGKLIPILVKAIQEMSSEIKSLKEEIEILKNK